MSIVDAESREAARAPSPLRRVARVWAMGSWLRQIGHCVGLLYFSPEPFTRQRLAACRLPVRQSQSTPREQRWLLALFICKNARSCRPLLHRLTRRQSNQKFGDSSNLADSCISAQKNDYSLSATAYFMVHGCRRTQDRISDPRARKSLRSTLRATLFSDFPRYTATVHRRGELLPQSLLDHRPPRH